MDFETLALAPLIACWPEQTKHRDSLVLRCYCGTVRRINHVTMACLPFSSSQEKIMAAQFEIKKSKNGQFYFNLKAANGETVLTSEQYTSKAGAKNGIASVKSNAGKDSRYENK